MLPAGSWKASTPVSDTHLDVYKRQEQNGTDGKVQAVHAGLECSIILSKYPNLDVVSFCPTPVSYTHLESSCFSAYVQLNIEHLTLK